MANASIFLVEFEVDTSTAEAASYERLSIVFAKRPCADTRASEEEGLANSRKPSPILRFVVAMEALPKGDMHTVTVKFARGVRYA